MSKAIASDDFIEFMVMLFLSALFVGGTILFSLVILNAQKSEMPRIFSSDHEVQKLLQEYLENTIEYQGQTMTLRDFIATIHDDDDNEKVELFQKHADDFFSKEFGGRTQPILHSWHIDIAEISPYVTQVEELNAYNTERNILATILDRGFGTIQDIANVEFGYQAGRAQCGVREDSTSIINRQFYLSKIVLHSTSYGAVSIELCTTRSA